MNRLLPFLATLLLLTACHRDNTIYDHTVQFPNDRWNHFQPEHFEVAVSNVEDYYNIDFTVAIDTLVYRYDKFPLRVEMTSPAGEERQFYYTVILKENGRWRGEVRGGYRTVQGRARSYFSFNRKGEHTLDISQTTGQYDLEGIHSLSVSIEKAKLDYNL